MSTFSRRTLLYRARRLGLAAILAGAWASPAAASDVFPPKIREKLGLPADPPCTICHLTDDGEDGTAVKPFGVTMQRLGVAGNENTELLIAALDQAEASQVDSDGDGVPDVTELREGSDPNDGPSANILPIPQTGCFLERVEAGSASALAMTLALTALALRARRRRRVSPAHAQSSHRLPR